MRRTSSWMTAVLACTVLSWTSPALAQDEDGKEAKQGVSKSDLKFMEVLNKEIYDLHRERWPNLPSPHEVHHLVDARVTVADEEDLTLALGSIDRIMTDTATEFGTGVVDDVRQRLVFHLDHLHR